ncbi:MAG: type VI secretion system ATPase TssH [Alphaproteobacteria bacterium]|nr:type VI secretion system ATPase TssH [Alphaproteobacteria bacterium]
MGLETRTLIGKLNQTCRKALEGAAELCVGQSHFNVEVEHLLIKLLDVADSDMARILRQYDIDADGLRRDLMAALDRMKRGNTRTPALSPHILTLLQEAWVIASLEMGDQAVRSGTIVAALAGLESLRGLVLESCPTLLRVPRDRLRQDMPELRHGSADDAGPAARPLAPAPAGAPSRPGQPSKTPNLDQYTIDLSAEARAGKIDPIQGRDAEIRQIVDILTRRRQNNPILTGEAGVGKTAVVEGFALRVARGDVPPGLREVSVRTLDLGLLQAGAGIKGEFENRLKSVIAEVKASPKPIILFIDEAHTMIGAGGQAGQNDAANLLKPALARGELRTIAATTWAEYKKYFEKDPALARRFQVIKVDEPDEPAAALMLRGIVQRLEAHHGVRILDEAVAEAVRLSHRYITGRQLPDKAIGVLDTAAARVAVGQNATPPALEDAQRRAGAIEQSIAILRRDATVGRDAPGRIAELETELVAAQESARRLEVRWRSESELVTQIRACWQKLEVGADATARAEMGRLEGELAKIQGEAPMVAVCVDARAVADVVSAWTGIPVGRMLRDEIATVLSLEERMAERIVGQPQALDAVAKRIRTYRANLDQRDKPVGVFLLVGPSGVGKTETALTLAELLYGGERNLITINMSEYQEAHTVSGLKGAPPGYVGYGTGGVLTEAVRHSPYSVVLLDEVEKAHPDVMDLFYQVFDKGRLEDGEGIEVDFRNTLIMLASNLGTERIMAACQSGGQGGGRPRPDAAQLAEAIRPDLLQRFKPAFLGRLIVVPYYPLGDAEIDAIVRLKLAKVAQRFRDSHRATLSYDDALIAAIRARCTEVDSGARNVDHILTQSLLPGLSEGVLQRMARGETFASVRVGLGVDGGFTYSFADGTAAAAG